MAKIIIDKQIADLRRKKGITQEQLAVAMNVSSQAVSKWESGV
ncbi:MAG: helix-turn-helix domain-containing protein [Oscillospiraceae bacterium]|nr:helix-turn-helix domain-containing protein [Oscillospiraceae bacterium]